MNVDRVHHDGQRRPGPGIHQPGGLTVGDHESHAGRHQIAQLADHRRPDAVVTAELVPDADDHDRPARNWNWDHRPF